MTVQIFGAKKRWTQNWRVKRNILNFFLFLYLTKVALFKILTTFRHWPPVGTQATPIQILWKIFCRGSHNRWKPLKNGNFQVGFEPQNPKSGGEKIKKDKLSLGWFDLGTYGMQNQYVPTALQKQSWHFCSFIYIRLRDYNFIPLIPMRLKIKGGALNMHFFQ